MIVIGLMSGTSADGIDAAICDITGQPGAMQAQIIAGTTISYEPSMRQRLLDSCDPEKSHVDEIARLNFDVIEIFAQVTLSLIESAGMVPADIDLIGSHGHTLWHDVTADGAVSASFQIGDGAVLAERTGITTINNFRARDIAAGGQGAPLTGYVDWLLLRHETHWRAVQNIGGMGNVTFLPPLNVTDQLPLTFDTGPGNALLDIVVTHFTEGAQVYDRDGLLAKQGRIDEDWLQDLLAHPYYKRHFPKSTGRETFGTAAAMDLIVEGQQRGLADTEIIATVTALTATTIAHAYEQFAPARIEEVILGGGGHHNPVMVGLLDGLIPGAIIRRHEDVGISSDFKEALVFAVLAYETIHGRVGALSSLTGARHPTVMGQIIPGVNFADLMNEVLPLWG